jgi:hypothetical protein
MGRIRKRADSGGSGSLRGGSRLGDVPLPTRLPEYAIAGTYAEFLRWRGEDLEQRAHVTYLGSVKRVQLLVRWARPRGVLHRIGTWESAPAREAATQLEAASWTVVAGLQGKPDMRGTLPDRRKSDRRRRS